MKITKVLQLTAPAMLLAGAAHAAAVAGPITAPLHALEEQITGPIAYGLGIAGLAGLSCLIVTSHAFAEVFTHMVKYVVAVSIVVGGVVMLDVLVPNAVATVSNQSRNGGLVESAVIALITLGFIAIMVRDAVRATRRAAAFIRARVSA